MGRLSTQMVCGPKPRGVVVDIHGSDSLGACLSSGGGCVYVCAVPWGPQTAGGQSRVHGVLERAPAQFHLCLSPGGTGVLVVWETQRPGREALGSSGRILILGLPGGQGDTGSLSSAQQPTRLIQDPPLESGRRCSLTPQLALSPGPHPTSPHVAFFLFRSGSSSVF